MNADAETELKFYSRSYRRGETVVSAVRYRGKTVPRFETKYGAQRLAPGDWIIKDGSGDLFVCCDEMFREIYDPVTE